MAAVERCDGGNARLSLTRAVEPAIRRPAHEPDVVDVVDVA